jgi:hypothetical protein
MYDKALIIQGFVVSGIQEFFLLSLWIVSASFRAFPQPYFSDALLPSISIARFNATDEFLLKQ